MPVVFGEVVNTWSEAAAVIKKNGKDPYIWAHNHPQTAVLLNAPYAITTASPGQPIYTTTPQAFGGSSTGPGGVPIIGPGGVIGTGGGGAENYGGGNTAAEEYFSGGGGDYGVDGGGGGTAVDPGAPSAPAQPAFPANTDWSQMLGIAGLPGDLIAGINNIFRQYPDANQAAAVALGFIRGSSWYQQTFNGINDGIANGLFADERGYRDYRNTLNQIYQQWTGRDMTREEMGWHLKTGDDPTNAARRFAAGANARAMAAEAQYLTGAFGTSTDLAATSIGGPPGADTSGRARGNTRLTSDEVYQLALSQQGLGTAGSMGTVFERALAQATERARRAFAGTAANPQLALTSGGKLQAPSLGGGRADVAA